jgi:NAD(P)-dependent dehydrogenase (short-subunit alcohol dehydrogenase family)
LTDHPVDTDLGLMQVQCDFHSAGTVDAGFAQAVKMLGTVREVVFSALPSPSLTSAELTTIAIDHWRAAAHASAKLVLHGLQSAARHLDGPFSFTLLGPNVGLTGAAGLVPLCTAIEAQRTLAKSAARQWGARGIRINWLAISAPEFDAAFGRMDLPAGPELGPPPSALGRSIDLEADVLPVLEFIGSPAAQGMTGLTINLDGGNWMLP